jgi:two-component system, cell cycle sensor histidine kinase and response regulator CckA
MEPVERRADRDDRTTVSVRVALTRAVGAVAAVALATVAAHAQADSATASGVGAAWPWRVRDATVSYFGIREGLVQGSVYAVHRGSDGTLRIGHDDGVSTYTGQRWVLDESPQVFGTQVRAFLEHDDWLWMARRTGVLRQRRGEIERYDAVTGGLADNLVYSLTVSAAFGAPTVVVGTAKGVARFTGRGFVAVPLPSDVSPLAVVVAATTGDAGQPTLWAGSAVRGLAAFHDGAWHVQSAADGITLRRVEALVAAPGGSGVEVYAAGEDGVWERANGRWRRVAMPTMPAYRLAVVPRADGGHELWVGSRTGKVLRRDTRGAWSQVQVTRDRDATPVIAVVPVASPTGEPDVYVGLRGDRLARVTLGPAAEVVLAGNVGPRFVRTLAWDTVTSSAPVLWAGTVGYGMMRATPTSTTFADTANGVPSINVFSVLPWRDTEGASVWITTSEGPAQWRRGRWTPMTDGVGAGVAVNINRVNDRDGQPLLALASGNGLFVRRANRWVRDSLLPPGQVSSVLDAPSGGRRVWWAVSAQTVFTRAEDGSWQRERPFGDSTSHASSLRHVAIAPGDSAVVVLSTQRGFAWRRDRDSTWHTVNRRSHPGLRTQYIWDVLAHEGRVYAAGATGVHQFRLHGRDSLVFETSYAAEDGLPSSEALSLAVSPQGHVWVATVRGIGVLPKASADAAAGGAPLLAITRRNPAATPVTPGELLPHDVGVLELELGLQNFHREQETVYRVALDGSGNPPTEWTSRTLYSFGALSPGTYTLRAWARDWRGRESALAPLEFRVAHPWWSSYAARAAYVLLLAAFGAWISRVRVRRLQLKALDLERNERRIAASERKFRALFDRAQDAHLLFEGDTLVSANAAARALVGAADEPAVASLLAPLKAPARTTELDGEVRLVRRADGAVVPVRETRTAIALDDRVLEHLVLRDESAVRAAQADARRLEEQLRETQKLESIGTLAGGVAHDFNNLLSVIRGNTELALAISSSGANVAGELREVLNASDRARELVRQILTFSRRTRPKRERVDLARLVQGLRGMLRATIPSSVQLVIHGPERGVYVEGDATQLQQALLNLCANAEYAMRETNGGRLEITVGAHGDEAVVTVTDSGPGIPPEVRARVFEPFYTTKPVGEGTGLGLSVLHGIVSAHGGHVSVDNAPGAGARFIVAVPLAAGEVASDARRQTPVTPAVPRGTGRHVVVVDDEPSVRSATARMLTLMGYTVRAFDDPAAALHAIAHDGLTMDLLLTDQTMPGMTGDLLVEAVRELRPAVPALIITGFSHRLTPERLQQLRVPVLLKPVGMHELGNAVAEVLGLSSPERVPG